MNCCGYSPVVGHLPNMHKALDSNPSTAKNKKKKILQMHATTRTNLKNMLKAARQKCLSIKICKIIL